ncbi:hypothetical protein ABB30_10380 [Stenotrophomonas ginsengisoli]|uniref:Short-chain dehydrogenase n=1 Tax=Stenotrophomonas ginsengisoli TaxID=336566 RepID=A0A0R0DFW5_9GAMM|nr:SDR family NAD(P)-dependent oxidoreductase [Stenotrophomonas ginsengisoli]KRG76200.1 hypothetical protein ABB30_10380 [Stenotrophomonas ginsengisoli]
MSPAPLAGQVVLVTGASGGLGGAMARVCAAAGAEVVASGRHLRRLEALYQTVQQAGGAIQLYPLDLEGAQPEDLQQLIERIAAEYGRLDLLIHCAADFPGLTPLAHADPAAVARAVHVNLTARIWLTQAALPALRAVAGGVVFAVDRPERGQQAYWGGYGLAQCAQHALVQMLGLELANAGVWVQALAPAPMPTALRARAYGHEVEVIRRPDEVAASWLDDRYGVAEI